MNIPKDIMDLQQIREVMLMALKKFKTIIPEMFKEIYDKFNENRNDPKEV